MEYPYKIEKRIGTTTYGDGTITHKGFVIISGKWGGFLPWRERYAIDSWGSKEEVILYDTNILGGKEYAKDELEKLKVDLDKAIENKKSSWLKKKVVSYVEVTI